ncbi:hypothetical protein RJ640_008086 [Escallonia rubra]|uniref:RING-type E3 ubiquitin transferase n=1 Tax=Escallonia rubra TaxID=112253 RepID=A0AA88RCR2_9ASTE|nr:hypothetical protein RJ640_008086 [Escallonia rubra]
MSSSGSDWMSEECRGNLQIVSTDIRPLTVNSKASRANVKRFFLQQKGNRSPIASLAESLLVSISEITASVACVGIEQENFFEFGCNLYRVSPVIMELQSAENPPTYITDILQSLSKSIILARDLVRKCKKGADTVLYPDTRSIAEQLEGVIKQIGEGLSLIPASAFEDQGYPEIAVQSLTKEMKSAHFEFHFFSSVELSNAKKDVQMETDLYSVDYEDSMVTPDLSERSHLHLDKIPESTNSSCTGKNRNRNYESLMTLPPVARYMEPLYETFFCPLTMKIMDDPVTVESGITYERKAITEWCQNFENPEEIFCPETGLKLVSKIPSTNTALKATIEEWEERNETERIKAARAVLSLSSTEDTILEALEDLRIICQRKQYNKVQLRNIGMIPGLTKFLEYKDRNVRCASLELLKIMAEDDDESKEMITKTIDISRIIKMLLSNHQPIKHAILLLLVELSRPQPLCDIIGSVTGAILMLITVKYRWSIDAFASEKADEILRNLERSSDNIKCMAENGHLEPLLNHIIEGSEEMKMKMASYLGEIVFGNDRKTYVAKRASPALIKMVHSGNTLTRNAAFKALKQMSSYHPNGEILVKAGIAVEKLLACLDRENVEVVEAALSAICTLLDDKVDVDKSVIMLSEVNAIQHVMNVVKEHREEGLWKKSFWVIERFLMKGGDKSASDISQDRLLPATLVSAFHHGDVSTSQMAEKILRHLNKMPNTTTNFTM